MLLRPASSTRIAAEPVAAVGVTQTLRRVHTLNAEVVDHAVARRLVAPTRPIILT